MARLFVPGPTDVAPDVLAAQDQPMIGHRTQACAELLARIQPGLRRLFDTSHRVLISASSGSGLQEAAVRNCVRKRLLVCVSGAFADRWYNVAVANGVPTDRLDVAWGFPITPEMLESALLAEAYDAVAIVHNETSTGLENPIQELSLLVHELSPSTLLLIDAVSSAGGVPIKADHWGLDVVLTSSQKCLALPPGLAFAAVSDRALEKARTVPNRGWYFDFLLLDRYLTRNATPTTPALSLLFALDAQLQRIDAEGLEARFQRHARMASMVQSWSEQRFALFAQEGHRSKTVTAIRKTRPIDVHSLNEHLSKDHITVADGYGPLKSETFRIAHMGELRPVDLEKLLVMIDDFMEQPA